MGKKARTPVRRGVRRHAHPCAWPGAVPAASTLRPLRPHRPTLSVMAVRKSGSGTPFRVARWALTRSSVCPACPFPPLARRAERPSGGAREGSRAPFGSWRPRPASPGSPGPSFLFVSFVPFVVTSPSPGAAGGSRLHGRDGRATLCMPGTWPGRPARVVGRPGDRAPFGSWRLPTSPCRRGGAFWPWWRSVRHGAMVLGTGG